MAEKQVSVNMALTQANDKLSKAVTSINPNATDAQILDFTTRFNALSTNSLVKTTRVEKYEVEEVTRYDVVASSGSDFKNGVWEIKLADLFDENNQAHLYLTANSLKSDDHLYFLNNLSVKFKPGSESKTFSPTTVSISFSVANVNDNAGDITVYAYLPEFDTAEENQMMIGAEAYLIIPPGSFESGGQTVYHNGATFTIKVVEG